MGAGRLTTDPNTYLPLLVGYASKRNSTVATFSVSLSFSPETQSNQKKKKQILERMANERKTRKKY